MSKLTTCVDKSGLESKTGTVLTARRFQNYILKNNINLRRATHDLCSNKNCYLLDFFLDGITTINNVSEITQQLLLSIDVDFYLSAGYSTFVITQESKPKLVHQIYARVNILTKVLSGSHTILETCFAGPNVMLAVVIDVTATGALSGGPIILKKPKGATGGILFLVDDGNNKTIGLVNHEDDAIKTNISTSRLGNNVSMNNTTNNAIIFKADLTGKPHVVIDIPTPNKNCSSKQSSRTWVGLFVWYFPNNPKIGNQISSGRNTVDVMKSFDIIHSDMLEEGTFQNKQDCISDCESCMLNVTFGLATSGTEINDGWSKALHITIEDKILSAMANSMQKVKSVLNYEVNDPNKNLELVYIDDFIDDVLVTLDKIKSGFNLGCLSITYDITLGDLAKQLSLFKASRKTLISEPVGTGITRALYSTYISYLPKEKFIYDLPKYEDDRGMFVEILKTKDSGQFSFFTIRPGITRGSHYHHSKTEKFCVVNGVVRLQFRKLGCEDIFVINLSDKRLQIIETIPGWVHDITNMGQNDALVVTWANEVFDSAKPDTISQKV